MAAAPRRALPCYPGRIVPAGLPGAGGGVAGLSPGRRPQRLPYLPDQDRRGTPGAGELRPREHRAVRRDALRLLAGPAPLRGGPATGAHPPGSGEPPGGRRPGPAFNPPPGHPHEPEGQRRLCLRPQAGPAAPSGSRRGALPLRPDRPGCRGSGGGRGLLRAVPLPERTGNRLGGRGGVRLRPPPGRPPVRLRCPAGLLGGGGGPGPPGALRL